MSNATIPDESDSPERGKSVSTDSFLQSPAVTTRASEVFKEILQAIVEGQIAAGSKISEPELARAYGISRGPLREALGRLEACHLILRKPNVGARVISLTNEELLEIYHIREALEGMACRLAAEKMGAKEVAELRHLLQQHMQNAELREGRAYYQEQGDLDFHYLIVQGSGNTKLINLLCNELYHLVRMYRFQFGMPSPRARRAFAEHAHIIDAIENGDGELAEILMRRHIRASRANIEKRLRVGDQSPDTAPVGGRTRASAQVEMQEDGQQ